MTLIQKRDKQGHQMTLIKKNVTDRGHLVYVYISFSRKVHDSDSSSVIITVLTDRNVVIHRKIE